MNKLSLVLLLIVNFVNAQINFEKGYFISNNGEKIECLIKNEDWRSNPTEIYYKISENEDKEISKKTSEIKELSIGEDIKFETHKVQMDISLNDLDRISDKRDPEFKEKVLFLKVIASGKAKLYSYTTSSLIKYFYSINNGDLEQLIYKTYTTLNKDGNYDEIIRENNFYLQQLKSNLVCSTISDKKIKNTKYNKTDLLKIFTEYNICNGSISDENALSALSKDKEKRNNFNFKIEVGVNNSSFTTSSPVVGRYNIDFESKMNPKIGGELEYILPFHKNKISVFLNTSWNSKYQSETTKRDGAFFPIVNEYKYNFNYSSIDLLLGGRYYFYLNSKSKIFVDASFSYRKKMEAKFIENGKDFLELSNSIGSAYGLGFEYDKVLLAVKINNRMLGHTSIVERLFKQTSFVIGYKIFEKNKSKND